MSDSSAGLLAALFVFSISVSAFAQDVTGAAPQHVVLTKLFQPVYPPLAKQTQITGDVVLALEVRSNGSLESAEAVSGHPLLKQAAVDSARRSQFECKDCGEGMRPFQMLYTFQLGATSYCGGSVETAKGADKEET